MRIKLHLREHKLVNIQNFSLFNKSQQVDELKDVNLKHKFLESQNYYFFISIAIVAKFRLIDCNHIFEI